MAKDSQQPLKLLTTTVNFGIESAIAEFIELRSILLLA